MQLLRIVQYISMLMAQRKFADATVPAIMAGKKWQALNSSMRSTRKIIRFLRSLEHSRKVIGLIKRIKEGNWKTTNELILSLTDGIASVFSILFFMMDHRVILA